VRREERSLTSTTLRAVCDRGTTLIQDFVYCTVPDVIKYSCNIGYGIVQAFQQNLQLINFVTLVRLICQYH
jgi:hypothetical protein